MGYVYGQPIIAKVRNDASDTKYSWAAIFGNGYNSTNENAVLYILNIKNGAIIRKNRTQSLYGIDRKQQRPVGTRRGGYGRRLHCGPCLCRRSAGNLWKIDMTDKNPSNWKSAFKRAAAHPEPLFAAVDGTTSHNRGTAHQRAARGGHASRRSVRLYGLFRHRAVISPPATITTATSPVQTFLRHLGQSETGSGKPVTRADLLPQTITAATVASTDHVRQVTDTAIHWRTASNIDS